MYDKVIAHAQSVGRRDSAPMEWKVTKVLVRYGAVR